MKRLLFLLAAAALALPASASGQQSSLQDTGRPENPGCYGDFASDGAQTGLAGEFVRSVAQMYKGNEDGTESSIGEDGVPFLKFISCPGDYRGRNAPADQP